MRLLGRFTIATLAAFTLASAVGVGTASAQRLVPFTYTVTNLAAGTHVEAIYNSGAGQGEGGTASGSGNISLVALLPNSMVLFPPPSGPPLTADVQQWIEVTGAALQGVASVPSGATVTLTNNDTDQQITLHKGRFLIPTGVGAPGAKLPKGGTQAISCKGSARSCEAAVPLAGGASNRKLVIRLAGTHLSLTSVTASPRSSSSGYLLSNGHFAHGRSEYIVTLNAAVEGNPRGSHLTLTFS